MTVEWTEIQFSSAGQGYVLAAPSPAQRRRTVNGRTFGWAGKVARFITGAVERAAKALYDRLCVEVEERFAAAKQAARDFETSRFVRQHLASFGSPDGRLRRGPLKARARAARTATALFGKRRVLRGEV